MKIKSLIFSILCCINSTLAQDNETFAIQNIKTNKCLRPLNANKSNENKIILYNHHNWKCITWEFTAIEENTYLLKNLYTEKTFEPSLNLVNGASLWQQEINNSKLQIWEFIKQKDDSFVIKLKDNELYITISSEKTNSEVILMEYSGLDEQKWKLIKQRPWL